MLLNALRSMVIAIANTIPISAAHNGPANTNSPPGPIYPKPLLVEHALIFSLVETKEDLGHYNFWPLTAIGNRPNNSNPPNYKP